MKKKISYWVKYTRYRLKAWLFEQLAPKSLGMVVSTDFGPMICDPCDNHVSRQLIKWRSYNPDEIGRYVELSEGMNSLLVVGSHIGALALQLADYFDKIVCVEANPRTFELLQINISLQNLGHKVQALNVAVTSEDKAVEFLCSRENSGGSKQIPAFSDDNFVYDTPDLITVPGRSLDSLFRESEFDFILMDIEGGEFDAIRGASNLIKSSSAFVVEFVPNHLARVANKSLYDFAELLLALDFDHGEFPEFETGGSPSSCLVETLEQITAADEYEDGVIFTRLERPSGTF